MPAVTTGKVHTPRAIKYSTLSPESFNQVTLGASVASTTIQSRIVLPVSCKIMGVISYASAVGATLPLSNLFNIAVGEGAYQTGTTGVPASATLTVANPTTGNVLSITFQGATFTYTVKSTDTTATILATSITQAWQQFATMGANTGSFYGMPLNKILGVWNNAGAGALVFTALSTGTTLNGQTITATSSGATTITASASLAGGVASTGITTPTNDTSLYNGLYPLATLGQAMFANDQTLSGPAPGLYGVFYEPTAWDAIYLQGTVLTLRASSGAGGSVTNWNVDLLVVPYDIAPTKPQSLMGAGIPFSPGRVIF